MSTDKQPVPPIGNTLRAVRRQRRLTLQELAERSGVSKSMLSQIERGLVNPTLSVLWHLTSALGIEIGDLLSNASISQRQGITEHLKAYSTPTMASADGLCSLRILSPSRTILPLEWYELTFQPGGVLASKGYESGTFLHLSALTGELRLEVGERRLLIEQGDTLRFAGDQDHRVCNYSQRMVTALLITALPGSYDGIR